MGDLIHKLEKPDRERKVEIRLRSSWDDVREAALNTSRKKYDPDTAKPLTKEMKEQYFISEHSPIRSFDLRITMYGIYYPTSVHFARHVHSVPYVGSSRPDRTKKARSLDNPTDHIMDVNAQALIDMARKRLCRGSCSQDTYLWMLAIKEKAYDTPELRELSYALVPSCLYRWACPEGAPCNMWMRLMEENDNRTITYRNKAYSDALFKYKENE